MYYASGGDGGGGDDGRGGDGGCAGARAGARPGACLLLLSSKINVFFSQGTG